MKKTKIINSLLIFAIFFISFPLSARASSVAPETIIRLTNNERIWSGENELIENFELKHAAQAKADDMIKNDYWEHFHQGKSPWDWMREANYYYLDAGENLAIDFVSSEEMVRAWMESPTHRANLLNSKYKEIGVGISKGDFEGRQTTIVVQMFGNPTPREESVLSSKENKAEQSVSKESLTIEKTKKENEAQNNLVFAENKNDSLFSKIKNKFVAAFSALATNFKDNFNHSFAALAYIIWHNNSASANN